jgi:hypothetical protein
MLAKKFFHGLVDLVFPSPNVEKRARRELEEARLALYVQLQHLESSELNIAYLEKKIARLNHILETGCAVLPSGKPIELVSSTSARGKNKGTSSI